MAKPNLDFKGRIKRVASGAFFIVLTLYFWLTLEVNKFPGLYRLVLVIPIYLASISFLEAFLSYCVLKDKKNKTSMRIHAASLAVAVIIAMLAVFV